MYRIILPIILLAGTAFGQSKPIASSFRDFSGGINNYSASVSLAPNESPRLMNVDIDKTGELSQRNGYMSCGSIPGGGTATNLYNYTKNDGSQRLIVTDNESIWETTDCILFSTITSGQSATSLPRFATVLDTLFIVNGTTWPITWDGTTATMLDGSDAAEPALYKAKYVTYWKSRVWLANTPTNPSSVYFSSLVDTDGTILSPLTSTAAWSDTNQIYISRNDGSSISAMRPYRDNLYIGKETGWNRIVFESEYDLSVAKNVTTIGTKFNESVVEMDDGLLRFIGRDGEYAFDGSTVKRLSTKWTPTFETLKQPSVADKYTLWDSATDWLAGTLDINISTIPNSGSVSLMYEDFADNSYLENPVWGYNTTASYSAPSATNSYLANYDTTKSAVVYIQSSKAYGTFEFDLWRNVNDDHQLKFISASTSSLVGAYWINTFGGAKLQYSGGTICSVSLSSDYFGKWQHIKIERSAAGAFTVYFGTYTCTGADNSITTSSYTDFIISATGREKMDNFSWIYKTTGTYTSQISTATGVTIFKTFDTDETLNGQTISYEIRTGTTPYNLGLASYVPITPGAVISTTTDVNYQWRASFTTTDNGVTPLLNSASAGWITGGSSKSTLYGINYKSRYWLSGSTTATNDYNDITIVESKSPLATHTIYDLPISAYAIWNSNLYGAIGNTAKIARLDYGSTDDGVAINSYWESRDELFENPIFYKTVNSTILDYANSPANTGLTVSLSRDMGTTFEDRTVNLSASTLARNTSKLNYAANTSLSFRTKVSNNVLGLGFKIYGLHNFGTMLPFIGN